MKTIVIATFGLVVSTLIAISFWYPTAQPTNAQIAASGTPKVIKPQCKSDEARDRAMSKEKLQKISAEVRAIQSAIEKHIAKRYPKIKTKYSSFGYPENAGIGRKGQAGLDNTWLMRTGSSINVGLSFGFDHDDALGCFRLGTRLIAMGDFFPAPDFAGDSGFLVNTVRANKKNTTVGLNFVKGRVQVSAYISNPKRTAAENEEELIEFVRSIEPLIVAKENIADL
ncbi:MAG TPA: hypothetical protein PKC65_14045 [Pyrinomonadaceae bacterium]|nr:hypothetical protein [Pyrinomonadaceae bacterium]